MHVKSTTSVARLLVEVAEDQAVVTRTTPLTVTKMTLMMIMILSNF